MPVEIHLNKLLTNKVDHRIYLCSFVVESNELSLENNIVDALRFIMIKGCIDDANFNTLTLVYVAA